MKGEYMEGIFAALIVLAILVFAVALCNAADDGE